MSIRSNAAALFLRRAYTVAVENVKAHPEASMMRKVVEPNTNNNVNAGKVAAQGVEKEVFWMRDPKSGNWVPETHFNQIDAAELREKCLSKSKAAKPEDS